MKVKDVNNKEDQKPGELSFREFVDPRYGKDSITEIKDLEEGDCVDKGMLGMRVKYRGELIPLQDYRLIRMVQYALKTQ